MPADQRPIDFTGTAVWAVREDGKLLRNWVERSSWELFQDLNAKLVAGRQARSGMMKGNRPVFCNVPRKPVTKPAQRAAALRRNSDRSEVEHV
jgi:hypothetical protein